MDSRRQRRKSYPLENNQRFAIPQRYPVAGTGSLYHCSCSNTTSTTNDSFNEPSYSNENHRNQTRTWKSRAGAADWSSAGQRKIALSKPRSRPLEDAYTKLGQTFDDLTNSELDRDRSSSEKRLTNITADRVSARRIEQNNSKRHGEAKGGSQRTIRLGVVEDLECNAVVARAASRNAETAGNGRFRRRRRDATASSYRATRRSRREERRARCFARTTVASRRAVVHGCRKKVCYSVIIARSSAVVPRRGCRVRRATSGSTRVRGRSRKHFSTSSSSSIAECDFALRGKIFLRLSRGVVVDCRTAEIFEDSEGRRGADEAFEADNGASSKFETTSDRGKSDRSSSSSLPVLGCTNARVGRRRESGDGIRGDRKPDDDDEGIVERIEVSLEDDDSDWSDDERADAEMKSKGSNGERRDASEARNDSNEDTERYDEFDAATTLAGRVLGKSPQSDEGIEPDTERRKALVARCWSPESTNTGEEDSSRGGRCEKIRAKQKVTRCCSSDSAVLSDEDQVKGWENMILSDGAECDTTEGQPRYWRTPSVVVSDYSDYSYLDEKYERSDPDLEKYEGGISGTPSQSSSCSCLDCDEIREFQDLSRSLDSHLLQVCGRRRHSDSCCACLTTNSAIANGDTNDPTSRRNSCLASPNPYRYSNKSDSGTSDDSRSDRHTRDVGKAAIELLEIPPIRKISDCSTNSSLSGDDFEVTELQPFQRPQVRNYFRDDEE